MPIFENMMRAREARGRSPDFQAEMARENAEFAEILNKLGKNTYDLGVNMILKAPTSVFLKAFKTLYDKKYKFDKYIEDTFKLYFGRTGIARKTIRVAANSVHLAGKGAKIGVRQLFKV
jgi:hypothetical protein